MLLFCVGFLYFKCRFLLNFYFHLFYYAFYFIMYHNYNVYNVTQLRREEKRINFMNLSLTMAIKFHRVLTINIGAVGNFHQIHFNCECQATV